MLQRFVDRGATAYAAELLGAAQRMLDESAEYAKERVQFDRPIGSFQAVKHRLADMLVDVEGMRSAVYWAAWCIAADHPDASVAASTAKVWCSDAARRVVGSALQVHGGIGFTWEHDVHLYLKRVQLDALAFGDAVTRIARGWRSCSAPSSTPASQSSDAARGSQARHGRACPRRAAGTRRRRRRARAS